MRQQIKSSPVLQEIKDLATLEQYFSSWWTIKQPIEIHLSFLNVFQIIHFFVWTVPLPWCTDVSCVTGAQLEGGRLRLGHRTLYHFVQSGGRGYFMEDDQQRLAKLWQD